MHAKPKRLIRYAEVVDRTGLSRVCIHKYIAAKKFPLPVEIGPHNVGFLESEVEAWIDARVAERGTPGSERARAEKSEEKRRAANSRWAKVREAAAV